MFEKEMADGQLESWSKKDKKVLDKRQ